ncbi:MAG TPA: LysR family transcriptional regulator, partial [Gemmatimonadetes bacterium]|nr:LysR family transcriptional regulator [Gemmatimonadota bacterium]
ASFTKAAGIVNLTQPAISLHIKRLEEQVGRKLIERGARKVTLTHEGEILLGYARRILALHREAEGQLGNAELSGTGRFGAPEDFDASVLSLVLAQFRRRHTAVLLEITIGLGPDVRRAFDAGGLDIAIINVEPGERDGFKLGGDDRVWVASPDFERRPDEAVPLVMYTPTCDWRRIATDLLDQSGIAWTMAMTSSGVTGLNAGIDAGLGISVAASKSVGKNLQIVGKQLGLPVLPPFEYRLVESPAAPAAARRLAFMIKEVFSQDFVEEATD